MTEQKQLKLQLNLNNQFHNTIWNVRTLFLLVYTNHDLTKSYEQKLENLRNTPTNQSSDITELKQKTCNLTVDLQPYSIPQKTSIVCRVVRKIFFLKNQMSVNEHGPKERESGAQCAKFNWLSSFT